MAKRTAKRAESRAEPSAKRPVSPLLQLGCAQLVVILIVTGLLLLANTLAVSIAFQSWLEARGRRYDPRLAQTILIVGPLLLLFVQYWLFDRVRERFGRRQW